MALFHFYFQFLAAIFDLRLTLTSHSVHMSPFGFLDHETADLVLEISLVPCIECETQVFHTCLQFMDAILISGPVTVINCTSLKSNLDAIPFSENRTKNASPF